MATYTAAFALSAQHKNVIAVLKYKDLRHTSCSLYDCTLFFLRFLVQAHNQNTWLSFWSLFARCPLQDYQKCLKKLSLLNYLQGVSRWECEEEKRGTWQILHKYKFLLLARKYRIFHVTFSCILDS